MKQPFSFKEFKKIYSQVPRISLDLIVRMDGGIVFAERALNDYLGQWHLPGGTLYYRESIKKGIKRIAKNETGLDVKVTGLLGYIEYFSEEKNRGFGYTIGLVFDCVKTKGKLAHDESARNIKVFKILPKNLIKEQKDFLKTKIISS